VPPQYRRCDCQIISKAVIEGQNDANAIELTPRAAEIGRSDEIEMMDQKLKMFLERRAVDLARGRARQPVIERDQGLPAGDGPQHRELPRRRQQRFPYQS
jgi:hypothetical protein